MRSLISSKGSSTSVASCRSARLPNTRKGGRISGARIASTRLLPVKSHAGITGAMMRTTIAMTMMRVLCFEHASVSITDTRFGSLILIFRNASVK